MQRIPLVTLLVLLMSVTFSWGETLYLKDGRVIKGEILERGSYYVTIQEENFPNKYFRNQIDRIEEDIVKEDLYVSNFDVDQFSDITSEKVVLIIRLIEIIGIRRNMEESLQQILNSAPSEQLEELRRIFQIDEIITRLVPVYDKYYDQEELRELIEFYDRPIGKKILEVTPQMVQEAMQVSIDYFKEKASP